MEMLAQWDHEANTHFKLNIRSWWRSQPWRCGFRVQLGLLPPYVHTHSTYGVLSNPAQMFGFFF